MKKFEIPYDKKTIQLQVPDQNLHAVIRPNAQENRNNASEQAIVQAALTNPLGTEPLQTLACGKKNVVIVTSDHTRAMPSRITLPLLLAEVRAAAPAAQITILVATGLHRASTRAELVGMFGAEIVNQEKIVISDAFNESDFVFVCGLPSGASFEVHKLAVESDLLITEGFIEPHFFAGFSGGRKSILPGICSQKTVRENHSYRAIQSPYATAGELAKNPIHIDMVFAARAVNVKFILNVALDEEKKIVAAWAGDLEQAHEAGTSFVSGTAQRDAVCGDIVITSNGGYPLDQNLYQAPKAIATAEACAGNDGVIIMCCSCSDGLGGDSFGKLMCMGTPEAIDRYLAQIPPDQTISEQWCAQIFARILKKHTVILVSSLDPDLVRKINMIPAGSADEALAMAMAIKGQAATVVVIPDGVAVMTKKIEGENQMSKGIALKVNEKDNVAVVFENGIVAGTALQVKNKSGAVEGITVVSDIPYGHKLAVVAIDAGMHIVKYGEVIGIATQNIRRGEHVHVQNMDSLRGRGDLNQ